MNPQCQPQLTAVFVDAWNEELSREKKFQEAVQRRAAEKKMRVEGQKLRKASAMESMVIETLGFRLLLLKESRGVLLNDDQKIEKPQV